MNSNDKVIFYYNPMSRGRIVHWMLEELEAPYEIKLLEHKRSDLKSPEYLAINPMGKVPSIIHRGTVVTESAAICAYLADAFPEAGLAPSLYEPSRGAYYRWLFFAASCIEPAMLDKKNPRTGELTPGQLGHGCYEDVVRTLEYAVKNGYLTGKFSAADLYMAANLNWCILTKVLEPKDSFKKYIDMCQDRPGFRRFMEQAPLKFN